MTNAAHAETVAIDVDGGTIFGDLHLPAQAIGLVLFAHGSGSSRFSSRNRWVSTVLERARFGTLLLDLLTSQEEAIDVQTTEYRFDIGRLARRVVEASEWAEDREDLAALPIGYFGASTGAAAALIAAAERPDLVRAVVSRGGRPDLAGEALPRVQAPTLLIVGGRDESVIDLNNAAMRQMTASVALEIVPGATHLFEEPGTLTEVARLAVDWFSAHVPKR